MIELKPSFLRVALKVGGFIAAFSILGYLVKGWQGQPWSLGYLESLSIPMVVMVVVVWFAFVPRRFAYSEHEITLSPPVGTYTYDWSDLNCYGTGRGVYKLKFQQDRQPYQIYQGAYSGKDWSAFIDFLNTRFPERKSSFSIGTRMFRDR